MFIAREVASQIVRSLLIVIDAIAKHDRALVDQLRRAASSIVLNVADGNRRVGRDRLHFFRIAAGSAAEVDAIAEVAVALGYVDETQVEVTRRLVDRELGLLWGLTHKRR